MFHHLYLFQAHGLSKEELAKREVVHIDIANDKVTAARDCSLLCAHKTRESSLVSAQIITLIAGVPRVGGRQTRDVARALPVEEDGPWPAREQLARGNRSRKWRG